MMTEGAAFRDLVRRVRAGDAAAAAEVVSRYEPAIRRAVRFRLAGTPLGTVFDSVDICQMVLASFFVRAAAGEYELDDPQQLLRLLVAMARNKLISQVRREQAQRRDHRQESISPMNAGQVVAPGPDPCQALVSNDLMQQVNNLLTTDERQLVRWRNEGLRWETIAQMEGKPAAAMRKQLSRAIDRVSRQLGLDGPHA